MGEGGKERQKERERERERHSIKRETERCKATNITEQNLRLKVLITDFRCTRE